MATSLQMIHLYKLSLCRAPHPPHLICLRFFLSLLLALSQSVSISAFIFSTCLFLLFSILSTFWEIPKRCYINAKYMDTSVFLLPAILCLSLSLCLSLLPCLSRVVALVGGVYDPLSASKQRSKYAIAVLICKCILRRHSFFSSSVIFQINTT